MSAINNNNSTKSKKQDSRTIQGTAQVIDSGSQSALGNAATNELLALIRNQMTMQQDLAKKLEGLEGKLDDIGSKQPSEKLDRDEAIALKMKERANTEMLTDAFRREHYPTEARVQALALRIVGDEDPLMFNTAVSSVKKWFCNSRSYFSSRIRFFAPEVIVDPEARQELTDTDLKMVLVLYRATPPNAYEIEQAREVLTKWPIASWIDVKVPAKRKSSGKADFRRSRSKRGRFTYTSSPARAEADTEKATESNDEVEADDHLAQSNAKS